MKEPNSPGFQKIVDTFGNSVIDENGFVGKGISINNMKIYFTQDLSQNATKLDKSLVEFVTDENGKYKMNTVEVKLLG